MDLLRRTVLPLAAGALCALYTAWLIFFRFSYLEIPVYIFLTYLLLRRSKGIPLAIGAGLLVPSQMVIYRLLHAQGAYFDSISIPFLVGILLLFLFVLVNTVHPLKKFRLYVNLLWFLPGAVLLVADIVLLAGMEGTILERLVVLNYAGCSLLTAFAALLIPLWLALTARDDLKPYLEMVGTMITEEQLDEKRRELGLKKR